MKNLKTILYIIFGIFIFISFNNIVYAERTIDYECVYKKETGTKDYKDYIVVTLNKDGSAITKMGDSKNNVSEKKLPFSFSETDYNLLRNYIENKGTCYPYIGFIVRKNSLFGVVLDTASFMENNDTREITYALETFTDIKGLWEQTGSEEKNSNNNSSNNTSSYENSNSSNNNTSSNSSSQSGNSQNSSSTTNTQKPSGNIIGSCTYGRTSIGKGKLNFGESITLNLYNNYGIEFVQSSDKKTKIGDYFLSDYRKNSLFTSHECPGMLYIDGNTRYLTMVYDTATKDDYTHIYGKTSSSFASDNISNKQLTCPYNVEVKPGVTKEEVITLNNNECKMKVYACKKGWEADCELHEIERNCSNALTSYMKNNVTCPTSFKFDYTELDVERAAYFEYYLDGKKVNNLPETYIVNPGNNGESSNTSNPDNPGTEAENNCKGLIGPNTMEFIEKALNTIMIVGPMLAVVLGSYDLIVAMANGEEDAKKKGIKKFKYRLFAAVLLLLLPEIIKFILSFFEQSSSCF